MVFNVLNNLPTRITSNIVYLIKDSWDDWFEFNTTYYLYYDNEEAIRKNIGSIKIGQMNMLSPQRRADLPDSFEQLGEKFFSLGQSAEYYEALNEIDYEIGSDILQCLNDIAYDLELLEKVKNERVTKISLLREISINEIKGQFNRIAYGGVKLTPFNFEFIPPKPKNTTIFMKLSFKVQPNSNPPSNIHVLIGRNGVGKTHLLNNMVNSLFSTDRTTKHGIFNSTEEILFSNIVFVSFSAFDEAEPKKEQRDKKKGLTYSYIGLKREKKGDEKDVIPKSPVMLKNEFIKSLECCRFGNRKKRWINSVIILESDPMFKESNILSLMDITDKAEFKIKSSEIFNKLSSGHKIVLLTITRLVETVEEKTLIMLDEPESHLHPPLLSAFIRTLSELLKLRNGVAIIATHSPVILQEVPKDCTWILNRSGISSKAERPIKETFGENVGTLTHDVFGLEVTNSGFYSLVQESVANCNSYEEVLENFNNKLGMEAKALISSLINLED